MNTPNPPLALLAELTHRCPLQCPYCSNPLALEGVSGELETKEWCRVVEEAAALGVYQIHFSGGEPAVRKDLPELVRHAAKHGLYTNLITSGIPLDEAKVEALAKAGLEHVQLSLQDADGGAADRIAGMSGAHEKKLAVARLIREAGLALTINCVFHRQNLERLDAIIDLAVALGAGRLEIAHAQYYGWAVENRQALLPSRGQIEAAIAAVAKAEERLKGVLLIDYVPPDYYARRPKACMGGWGNQFLNVSPSGKVLPCHAAEIIPGLRFDNVRNRSLADIWHQSDAVRRFRGTDWMPEPCRSCDRREIDWGGCRCQALMLTGNAANTDPVCELSPEHALVTRLVEGRPNGELAAFRYRRMDN
ncbi:MAG: pyrroloquinoline quinone biosynthesis protein PqqE [Alphaproteobacteria bacterium]